MKGNHTKGMNQHGEMKPIHKRQSIRDEKLDDIQDLVYLEEDAIRQDAEYAKRTNIWCRFN